MSRSTFLVALFLALRAHAYFILTHSPLETTRLDPVVSPGQISGHVHSIAGGNNFDKSMTYASSLASTCTTAPVSVDLSNYWVPQLYYYNPTDATYQAIPIAFINTYYLPRAGKDGKVSAFPDGLRMVQGNPNRRTFNNDADSKSISYVCLDYYNSHQGDPAWDQRNDFFQHNCPDGMRAQVFFRSCWDGVNLDSPNHQDHMAWPSGGVDGGECPASHPVRLVSLFYEFVFAVQKFPYNTGNVPTWVWANGDTTGNGFHGDFVNGWPSLVNGTNVLQQAIDGCNDNNGVGGELKNCPPFVQYLDSSFCPPLNPLVAEDIGMNHPIALLPGNNPIWIGNGTKPSYANYTDPSSFYTPQSVIPTGYSEVGCIAEGTSGRALTAKSYSGPNVTRAVCVQFCQSFGYPLAGMEYGQECYCDNQMRNGASNTTLLASNQCSSPCANNTYESCGGARTLNLFNNPSLYTPAVSAKLPSGWNASGCYTEGTSGRALAAYSISASDMTYSKCINTCQGQGYNYAGVEYSRECYCGNLLSTGSNPASSSDCNMACSGDSSSMCGGPSRLTLFQRPAAPAAALPAGWTANGCMTEATNRRALANYSFTSTSMTPAACISACSSRGYKYAGAEYASECYCGSAFQAGSVAASASDCSMGCSGDKTQFCGAGSRLTTWVNQTAPGP